jgi:hypothetical protein
VSAHLHLWIDLIFGSKQTGDEAEKALNKFYFLTYQDAIDTEALRDMDPDKRKGIEAQIADYGQTPRKLFTRPHPPRRAAADIALPVFSGELSKLLRPSKFAPGDDEFASNASPFGELVSFALGEEGRGAGGTGDDAQGALRTGVGKLKASCKLKALCTICLSSLRPHAVVA